MLIFTSGASLRMNSNVLGAKNCALRQTPAAFDAEHNATRTSKMTCLGATGMGACTAPVFTHVMGSCATIFVHASPKASSYVAEIIGFSCCASAMTRMRVAASSPSAKLREISAWARGKNIAATKNVMVTDGSSFTMRAASVHTGRMWPTDAMVRQKVYCRRGRT